MCFNIFFFKNTLFFLTEKLHFLWGKKKKKSGEFTLKPFLDLRFHVTQKTTMQIKLFSLLLLNIIWTWKTKQS